jgi:hypothetical protein
MKMYIQNILQKSYQQNKHPHENVYTKYPPEIISTKLYYQNFMQIKYPPEMIITNTNVHLIFPTRQ